MKFIYFLNADHESLEIGMENKSFEFSKDKGLI